MYSQLLVCPVEAGGKAHPVRVLHLFERIFHMGLGPAAEDNLFGGPIVVVRAQNALAESVALQSAKRLRVGPEGKVQTTLGLVYLGLKNFRYVLAGCDLFEMLFQRFGRIAFPPASGFWLRCSLARSWRKAARFLRRDA